MDLYIDARQVYMLPLLNDPAVKHETKWIEKHMLAAQKEIDKLINREDKEVKEIELKRKRSELESNLVNKNKNTSNRTKISS